jgi:hypothetical protein
MYMFVVGFHNNLFAATFKVEAMVAQLAAELESLRIFAREMP